MKKRLLAILLSVAVMCAFAGCNLCINPGEKIEDTTVKQAEAVPENDDKDSQKSGKSDEETSIEESTEVVDSFLDVLFSFDIGSDDYDEYFADDKEMQSEYEALVEEFDSLADMLVESAGTEELAASFGKDNVEDWMDIIIEGLSEKCEYEIEETSFNEDEGSVEITVKISCPSGFSKDDMDEDVLSDAMKEAFGFDIEEEPEKFAKAWIEKENLTEAEMAEELGDLTEEELGARMVSAFEDEFNEFFEIIIGEMMDVAEIEEEEGTFILEKQDGEWKITEMK